MSNFALFDVDNKGSLDMDELKFAVEAFFGLKGVIELTVTEEVPKIRLNEVSIMWVSLFQYWNRASYNDCNIHVCMYLRRSEL